MKASVWRLAATVILLSGACAADPAGGARVGASDPGRGRGALRDCGGGELELDRLRPLVLFVPGVGDPGGRYTELAWRFEQEGAQAVCFAYDERQELEASTGELIGALEGLEASLSPGRIIVLGHGQGGLIARRALVEERRDRLRTAPGFTYALVTVATPFGGMKAAADCGRTWLHVLTLGTSALVCNMISGNAWRDLPANSRFIRWPGTLVPEVREAIGVVTQERGSCRRRTAEGACDESDAVFTLHEQRNPAIEADPRWARVLVAAGHEEIVGAAGTPPVKLFTVLEAQGILAPLPAAQMARP